MTTRHEFGGFPAPSTRMPFIVSSSVDKVDPATRKLIRSHVMRGKKKRKRYPEKVSHGSKVGELTSCTQVERINLDEVIQMYTPQIPTRIGGDLSFIDFAEGIELSMLLNITKVSTVATKVIFPLLAAIGFQAENKEWLYLVGKDAAALHITAFAVEIFIDRVLRRWEDSTNPTAILHLHKGLRLLRERLVGEDDEPKISDSTIGVVLKLASAAHFNGDYEASKQHMDGLRKMVDLRGGLDVFNGTRLLLEMLRYDLDIALLNGSDPVFYCLPSEKLPDYPAKLMPTSNDSLNLQNSSEFLQNLDSELATAWRAMRRFCLLVNLGAQTRRLMRPDLIRESMTAVTYRLLRMKLASGSMDEAIRHGLLAFCHHVFLQWQDIKLPYHYFPTVYRECIQCLKAVDAVSPQLILWLLMAGAISVFGDEEWLKNDLREYTEKCGVKRWKEIHRTLNSLMWISLLDEQLGRNIYDSLYLDKSNAGNHGAIILS
ncbi:Hypothetical protein NCS54_00002400 [Fusarium falciforme]|uniref:Hypothetical protein n=1 Tax=Fusarium falciforme TaxID=195108 RepID=UPI0022FFF542|nr:Hypothetical protein NCS54_00002400 [Fusarium falciforme]WAO82854.1 Hypothetical protein NCS54_00002400 [Fusarium falciforme]